MTKQLDHPYFGPLDTRALSDADVIWERSLPLRGVGLEVSLWADPATRLDGAVLDALATRLQALEALDTAARTHLTAYLTQDRFYIDDHAEELEGSAVIDALLDKADGSDIRAEDFAAAMTLERIGLWLCMADGHPVLVMDYMIDADASDQILAVKVAADGTMIDVAWES